MDPAEALERIAPEPSGHLATVRSDGRPHVVVVTYAVDGGEIVTAIDHKPKTTRSLQRLANIEANPQVSFLVDHYEDDWDRLWWIRVDGPAVVVTEGTRHASAVTALAAKYPQYRERPPDGPAIVISPETVASWPRTR